MTRAVVGTRLRVFAAILSLAASGCRPSAPPRAPPRAPPQTVVSPAGPGSVGAGGAADIDGGSGLAVRADAGVASGELAWLVSHLADDPDPARGGESDAGRRLAARGADGVHAVAEVFRVGDLRRTPFARRVIERVSLTRCHWDRSLAGQVIAGLEGGRDGGVPDADAGIVWRSGDATRWSGEAVGRLHRWADAGMPCVTTDGGLP